MKKLFIAALLSVTAVMSSFAADTKKISVAATSNFSNEYASVSNVTWSSTDSYIKASFTQGNQKMEAFYNFAGEKIATSKSISLDELPMAAKRAFAKRYSGYTVSEAIRFDGADEGAYYIAANKDDQSVILKVSDSNLLSTYKKMKN